MAKLVLMRDNVTVREIALDKQDITVGRSPDNEIPLDDQAVSRRHVRVITILNDSFMEDLNSTNGTYVNGKLTKKHALQDGDVILVGRHQLKYVADAAGTDDDDDFNKTRVMLPGQLDDDDASGHDSGDDTGMGINEDDEEAARVAQVEGYGTGAFQADPSAAQAAPDPTPAPVSQSAVLQILNGAHAGKQLRLDKAMTNIGRAGQQVAAISRRPHGFFLIHMDSGGTGIMPMVNGNSLPPNGQQLQENDIVEIGGIKMQFFYA